MSVVPSGRMISIVPSGFRVTFDVATRPVTLMCAELCRQPGVSREGAPAAEVDGDTVGTQNNSTQASFSRTALSSSNSALADWKD